LPIVPSRWLTSVALGTVLLALLGGGALAWLRNKSRAQAAEATPQKTIELPPLLSEEQRQEKFMREAVEQYSDPGKDPMRIDLGLKHALELGLYYLKHHRLEDADQFFLGLRDNRFKVEAYRTLGLLGHAIVLGLQNQAAESNRAFLEVVGERGRAKVPDRLPFLLAQPQLRPEIAWALDYNKINSPPGQSLPSTLEALRKPPDLLSPQPGGPRRNAFEKKLGKNF